MLVIKEGHKGEREVINIETLAAVCMLFCGIVSAERVGGHSHADVHETCKMTTNLQIFWMGQQHLDATDLTNIFCYNEL